MKRSTIPILLALTVCAWAWARHPAHRATVLASLATATFVIAALIYPASDLLSIFVLAALWFLVPLAVAAHRGDEARIGDLLDARRDPLTMHILRLTARMVTTITAIFANVVGLLVAYGGFLLLRYLDEGGPSSSDQHLPDKYLAQFVPVAIVAVLFVIAFAAGRSKQEDQRWWGARRRAAMWRDIRARPLGLSIIIVGMIPGTIWLLGLYAVPAILATSTLFDQFDEFHLNPEHLVVSTAAGLLVASDVLAWLRGRRQTAESAIRLMLGVFATSLLASWLVDCAARGSDNVWFVGPAVLTGAAFGVSIAALLDLGQAIATGMSVASKPKDPLSDGACATP
jgi:hypothetical protein